MRVCLGEQCSVASRLQRFLTGAGEHGKKQRPDYAPDFKQLKTTVS